MVGSRWLNGVVVLMLEVSGKRVQGIPTTETWFDEYAKSWVGVVQRNLEPQ